MTTTNPEKHFTHWDAENRIVHWDAPPGEREEWFSEVVHRTFDFCVRCGRQGTWACAGPIDNPDHRLCQYCGTIVGFSTMPELASGFWATILRQILV